jgi:enoyl-CoA hydratase
METVRIERDGPVWTVVLSRPDTRNAVDGPTATALASAFRAFDATDDAAVAVLWGEGGSFCAGFDLKALGTETGNPVAPGGDASSVGSADAGPMGPTHLRLGKPVVAAVAGYAVGGGLELALWCDLRVAAEDAIFGVFNRRWGVPLVDGGTVRLPRLVGAGRAMELVLTGRAVSATEAFEIGLVNRVVPVGGERAAAQAWAAELARFPQTGLRHDRLSLLEQDGLSEADALANELRHGQASLNDAVEGARRFAGGAGRGGSFSDLG